MLSRGQLRVIGVSAESPAQRGKYVVLLRRGSKFSEKSGGRKEVESVETRTLISRTSASASIERPCLFVCGRAIPTVPSFRRYTTLEDG